MNFVKEADLPELLEKDSDRIRVVFRFLTTASNLESEGKMATKIEIMKNKLEGTFYKQTAVEDKSLPREVNRADHVVPCIGYESRPIKGEVFDPERKLIPSAHGCVLSAPGSDQYQVGKYASGWVKTGASGGLDATFRSSIETVNNLRVHIIHDKLEKLEDPHTEVMEEIKKKFGNRYTTFKDWQKIDALEQHLGQLEGRVRVKLNSNEEIFEYLENNIYRGKKYEIEKLI